MKTVLLLTRRNLRLFFRDKSAVFFSLLAVFIIIGLYALFLGDLQVSIIKDAVGDINGVRFMVDSWIISGLIAINTVTVTLGAFGTMVKDENDNTMKDFLVSPINRSQIVGGYVLSSLVIGAILSFTALILGEIYIVSSGGELLSPLSLLKALGIILMCIFSSSGLVYFLVTFVKSESAFASLSTILGTLIGFVAGIYVPLGVMPPAIRTFVKFFPVTHGAALLRRVFTERPLSIVFENAPKKFEEGYRLQNGIDLTCGGEIIPSYVMIIILAASGIVFFSVSVLRTFRKRK